MDPGTEAKIDAKMAAIMDAEMDQRMEEMQAICVFLCGFICFGYTAQVIADTIQVLVDWLNETYQFAFKKTKAQRVRYTFGKMVEQSARIVVGSVTGMFNLVKV